MGSLPAAAVQTGRAAGLVLTVLTVSALLTGSGPHLQRTADGWGGMLTPHTSRSWLVGSRRERPPVGLEVLARSFPDLEGEQACSCRHLDLPPLSLRLGGRRGGGEEGPGRPPPP